MNLPTLIIVLALVAVVAFVIRVMINDKKNGKTCGGCGGNCSGCGGSCHSHSKTGGR